MRYLSAQGWCQELINILNGSRDACPVEVDREGNGDSGERRQQRKESQERTGSPRCQLPLKAGLIVTRETWLSSSGEASSKGLRVLLEETILTKSSAHRFPSLAKPFS